MPNGLGHQLPAVGCADSGGRAAAQAVGQSVAIQREVLCRVGTGGTGQRPDVAGKGHECVESALAQKKCCQKKWFANRAWPARWSLLGSKFLIEIRKCAVIDPCDKGESENGHAQGET